MPGQISWNAVFHPNWEPGGLSNVARSVTSRVLDDFESYASDGALQAVWTLSGAGGPDLPVRTSAANALKGQQSVQVALTGGPAALIRSFSNNFFHFPAGGRIRYVSFRGLISTGSDAITVRLGNAGNTIYKEWAFTLDNSTTREMFIDLYSGGAGYQNTESNPGPSATLGTWDPSVITTISFRDLASGSTYRFDDVRFWYDYSLYDLIGFGTEPPTDDGADGSIQSKLRYLNNLVLQKIGETQQYSKYGAAVLYLNNSYTFGLELKSGLFIPSTTEITPGNYTINRVRNGTTTEIVASTTATEAAGFISATYTPLEDNWQPGDQLLVTFSGGLVDKDTDTAELLTANANAATTTITVANAALFQAGQRVRIYDDTPDTEIQVIVSIDSPTTLTVGALANNYTTAATARIVLVERTSLETARLAANITYEPQISQHEERWVLADYDDFDFADADGNNERWDDGYIANSDGSAAGAEGGSANINTTTAGMARVSVDPDVTPTQSAYALKRDEPTHSQFFTVAIDADVTIDISQASSSFAGLRVSAGDVDDPSNYILVAREASSAVNRITARAEFMGAVQTTVNFNTTDNAVAFKIERYGNTWNVFYSLTQWPNWVWTKLTQFEDANGDMTGSVSMYLYTESGGTADAQTSVADFDNFKYYIGSGALDQILSLLASASGTFTTSSTTVPADTGRLEGDNYWNGMLLMPITGVAAYQSRTIVDFANAGGVFTIDAQNPFSVAPAVGDEYVILTFQYPLVPAADAASNQTEAHVVGNKSDAAAVAAGTASVIARLRAIEAALSVNAAGGGEFELDGVPDLWDALVNDSSAQAEITTLTGDRDGAVMERLAAFVNAFQITDAGTATGFEEDGTGGRLWESITAVKGTFTTSSATVPADTGRTEADNYFNGDIIVPISGGVVRQARLIVDFANAGGVFTIDSENPFTAAPGLVDYVILHFQAPLVPAADSTANQTTAHVVGSKTDTADYTAGATASSIMRLLKGLLGATVIAEGTFTTSSATVPADTGRAEADSYWDGSWIMPITGAIAFQPRLIINYANAGGVFTLDAQHPFTAVPGTVAYVILSPNFPLQPAADATTNTITPHTVGNKADTAAYTRNSANSLMRYLKGLHTVEIITAGTFTTSSATVPADTGRAEGDNYWNGSWLIPLTGAVALQPRLITDFANAGGVFTIDPEQPFTAATGLVTYVVISPNSQLVPAADTASNSTPAHVGGNKTDAIPAMNAAPGNDSQVAHLKAILERVGATPADPDDSLLTNVGQRDDTATADSLADITTTSIQAKLRRLLLRFSADAFSSTVQGVARTDVENMIQGLANYLSSAGAAWSVTANPGGAAKDNLEQTLEDFADMLAGTTGIVTFPARVQAGDGVSVAEVLRHASEAVGENTANNVFDSSTVVANEDGSVLERLEDLQLSADRADLSLADYDDFDVADADGNTERWNTGYTSGAEGGSADINTTTAGKAMVQVDPDATPTASGYAISTAQPFVSKYFSVVTDVDVTYGTSSASWAAIGMRISAPTFDANNQIYIQRQRSTGGVQNRITGGAIFNSVNQGEVNFTTSDTSVAFKVERLDNVWRLYYSLSQYPNYVWVLLVQYEDPSEFMDSQMSFYLDAYSPGTLDAETARGDFDNWKLYLGLNGLSQEAAGDYDSSAVAADEDGSFAERLEQIQEAVNRGSGTSIAANRSLVDALGSDGTTVTDSAVSVLGAIGADNANNAFASTLVAENGDGSVLERLEEIRGSTTAGTFTLTNAMGTAEQTVANYTPLKLGRIAVLLDLNTLVAAVEGGTVISRLKFMIDGATLRTIDRADFVVGTDEVHPTVSGFVAEGASFVRITIQANSAASVNRDIPYRIIESS